MKSSVLSFPATRRDHVVQFYEDDQFLSNSVAEFLADGLTAGQPGIAIATPSHRHAFEARLHERGFDLTGLRARGQLTFLDARDTLSTFMQGTQPDPLRFRTQIGSVIAKSLNGRNTTARAYGEMVDLLWQDQNVDGAIRLEELWNDLAGTHSFTLLCAYAMGHFYKEGHARPFLDICGKHSRVIPAESYTEAPGEDARAREISRLQQRAKALEAEIAKRSELERSLRDALLDRQHAHAERELLFAAEQAARAEAEQANRLKDEFLAVLSHELRTPLNAILGWAHIVRDPRTDEATIRRALDVIQRNATLQAHLIDELLDMSRIVTGKLRMSTDRVNLATVIAAAAESIRPAVTAKDIDFTLDIDRSARFVTGDAARLHQVIWNLLSNAIKFTPEGGRIALRLERRDSHARIVVRDTGQGIAHDFLPHVFDRFRQEDTSTTRRQGGLGLGLTLVRYLVEAHGGTVSAESPGLELGSTFAVTLPIRASTPQDAADRESSRQSLRDARILIVDGEEDARDLLRHMLGQLGSSVETAATAGEAIRWLSSRSFDLILADIGMPGQDGYALIAAIRSLPDTQVRSIPAIAMSAYAGHSEQARAAGYNDYLTKPVDPARLAAIATRLLV